MHANPDKKREMVLLGRITGAQGIKGWARVHSDTEPREAIFEYQPWLVGAAAMPVQVLQGKRQGKYLVAELAGISDRDAVESLAGRQIAVYRDQFPDLG